MVSRGRKAAEYGRRLAGVIAGSRRAWWLYWFVSVKTNGLEYFLEQSKMCKLTALNLSRGGYSAGHGYTFRETGRTVLWLSYRLQHRGQY